MNILHIIRSVSVVGPRPMSKAVHALNAGPSRNIDTKPATQKPKHLGHENNSPSLFMSHESLVHNQFHVGVNTPPELIPLVMPNTTSDQITREKTISLYRLLLFQSS